MISVDTPDAQHTAKRQTLAILLGVMAFAAVLTLWGALRSVQLRRSRDTPSTQLPEAALLARLPVESRQVLACRPGWTTWAETLQTILQNDFAFIHHKQKPTQWVAGWSLDSQQPTLVADFPGASIPTEGWTAFGGVWTQKGGLQTPGKESGWAPGLSLVVKNRLQKEAVVWTAGMGTPWENSSGSQIWSLASDRPQAAKVSELVAVAKTWLVWLEPQPNRTLIRAELECSSPQEASRIEKVLESFQHPAQPGNSLRFLADGPWLSLQATMEPSMGLHGPAKR